MPTPKTSTINLRIHDSAVDLIDRAAKAAGKNRTEFVLDAARREAENVLLDQRLFLLDPKAFQKFESALNQPLQKRDALKKLLNTQPPWST